MRGAGLVKVYRAEPGAWVVSSFLGSAPRVRFFVSWREAFMDACTYASVELRECLILPDNE